MRRMSMGLTEDAFLRGEKDVTRRLGWSHLVTGEQLLVVNRVMGISPERPVKKLGIIEVISARREPLNWITPGDVKREGFPYWSPKAFVEFFCTKMRCAPDREVTRIEFKVLSFHGRRKKKGT